MHKRPVPAMPEIAAIRQAHAHLLTARALLAQANEDHAATAVRHALRTTQARIHMRTRAPDLH